MQKVILFIAVLLSLFACSKDDSENSVNKFSAEETKILKVLDGKWEKDDKSSSEVLSFSPYSEKKMISGIVVDKEIVNIFHGDAICCFSYLGKQEEQKMYFYVNTEKKEIHLYRVEEDGKFSIVQTKSYDYNIIDNNTIQLHDKSLSGLLVYNYKRIR
jgi:hypothetical protein